MLLPPLSAISLIAFVVGVFCTVVIARSGPLDTPNTRSLHRTPTPRAAGVAIICVASVFLLLGQVTGQMDLGLADFWLFAGLVFAAILGFADDVRGLGPMVKFGCQALIGFMFALVLVPDQILIPLPWGAVLVGGYIMIALVTLWTIGIMNTVNFMDGANGMAVLTVMAIMGAFAVHGGAIWAWVAVLGCLAVFIFNAKGLVFLGDVGSQMLGVWVAAYALPAIGGYAALGVVAVGLAPFTVDVGCTLLMRFFRGEPVLQAHRQHLYQIMIDKSHDHLPVSAVYALFAWLGTMAALTGSMLQSGLAISVWYGAMIVAWIWVRRVYVRRLAHS